VVKQEDYSYSESGLTNSHGRRDLERAALNNNGRRETASIHV
jgi:hypothetical protein